MASYRGRVDLQVVDFNGDTAVVSFPQFLTDTHTIANVATNVAALATVVAAATNGKIIRQSFSFLINVAQYLVGTTPPTNAEYSSVTDGAHFSFGDGAGNRMSCTIPAPLEAMFGASSNVIDPLQTQAAALIAAVAADCQSPANTAYNLYKGGVKVGRHSRKRVTPLIP